MQQSKPTSWRQVHTKTANQKHRFKLRINVDKDRSDAQYATSRSYKEESQSSKKETKWSRREEKLILASVSRKGTEARKTKKPKPR
jgi:hypothetical protein